MRKIIAYGYLGFIELLKSLVGYDNKVAKHVVYYPTVKNISTLAELINRISWYIPKSVISKVEVYIVVDKQLLNTDINSLSTPEFQENYIGHSNNIHLIANNVVELSKADVIMLWNKNSMFHPRVLRHLTRVKVADPWFYHAVEANVSARLYYQAIDKQKKESLMELSKGNFQALLDKLNGVKKAYLFGTGPSLGKAQKFDYDDGFRVICNTIVKNRELLHHIKPQLLVFTDSAFHFGPSLYSAEFRSNVMEAIEEFQCYIMVPEHHVPLMLAHYPRLENNIIGMPAPGVWDMSLRDIIGMILRHPTKMPLPDKIPGQKEKFNFPTRERYYVRPSSSVLPSFMIAVASSVCKNIFIIGADGRKPSENYYWTHNTSAQYSDLMQTLFYTHPSIFRDALYADQYNEHCEFFEGILKYGESLGKKYYSLTPSYIPALEKRPAPPEEMILK